MSRLYGTESKERFGKHRKEISNRINTQDDGEYTLRLLMRFPQTLELDESSNVIDFTSDNMEDMRNAHYYEFNKAIQILCLPVLWTYVPQTRRP